MSAFIGAINVCDYAPLVGGVPQIGQGVTDDTQAIKDAIQALMQMTIEPPEAGVTLRTTPTIYFPAGIYNIKSELRISFPRQPMGCAKVLGENAIIRPNPDPEHPFVGDYALRVYDCEDFRLEHLNFLGFDKAVRLENANPNSMQVMVEECGFFQNQTGLELACQSAISVIDKCKFFENKKAMHFFFGDQIAVQNCWIEAGIMTGTHPAQIENHASLTLLNSVLTPHLPNAIEPAWINNYRSVTVKDTRQGAESGSFTLINNFAPVESDANSVIVKDSRCCAVYGNTSDYFQPAILRYVGAIPNQTIIRDNRGLMDGRLVEFSYHLYQDNTTLINAAIASSGTSSAGVDAGNVVVEVVNNEKGLLYNGKTSFVPRELYPYVRSEESIWPDRYSNALELLDTRLNTDGSVVFTYAYGPDSNVAYLINYTGRSYVSGSTLYSGGFVGVLKANGFWTGAVTQSLVLQTVFNQIGDPNPGTWPTGQYAVEAYWEASNTPLMYDSHANRNFCIKIIGRDGAVNAGYDRIKVTALDSL